MPAHMKKHLTKKTANVVWHGDHYQIPLSVIEKYRIDDDTLSIEEAFNDLTEPAGEPAILLKGLRAREGLTQTQFAEAIDITQANLSAMENGKRSIGKDIAKRVAKKFKVNYRLFL